MLGWFKRKKQKNGSVIQQNDLNQNPPSGNKEDPSQGKDDDSANSAVGDTTFETAETPLETEDENQGAAPQPALSEPASITPDGQDDDRSLSSDESSPSMLKRLSDRLARTRASFTNRIDELFLGKKQIDAELFDELEEILVTADLGIATTRELLENARKLVKRQMLSDPLKLKGIIKEQLRDYIGAHNRPADLLIPESGPLVIMVVGVNGVGKTTTIGKIAKKFLNSGQTVLLVAADTFRAAAASQLKIWGERNNIRVISQHEGADPSSVVFDAMEVAKNKGYDVVLVDTAGRLHTKVNLMEELKKIQRVIGKRLEGAPHEVLLVIDATTGQNGISQARLFNEAVGVTGIALTKLDGTAKGGIIANIARELELPIRFIGVGEQVDDLRDFDANEFIDALFATDIQGSTSITQQHREP